MVRGGANANFWPTVFFFKKCYVFLTNFHPKMRGELVVRGGASANLVPRDCQNF